MTDTADRVAAAQEIRRFFHGLRNVMALADDIEELASIEQTIAETRQHLDALKNHDGKWREVAELEAALPELQSLQARIQILRRIENYEEAEREVAATLLNAQNSEAAIRARLADLQVKCDDAGVTLANLDQQVTEKRAALVEIERALGKWRARLAG